MQRVPPEAHTAVPEITEFAVKFFYYSLEGFLYLGLIEIDSVVLTEPPDVFSNCFSSGCLLRGAGHLQVSV